MHKMPVQEKRVYQLKITLVGIKPTIWRRIQISDSATFGALHGAIQGAMGWENCHLHQFQVTNPKTGVVDMIGSQEYLEDDDVVEESKKKISAYFSLQNKKAYYEYDFGDSWEHTLLLEKVLPVEIGKKYPLCLDGERACPPEDCGGVWGYERLLEIMKEPDHPEYEEQMDWLVGSFDPEAFNPQDVVFS
jgi:hypothetical protein